MTDDNKTNFSYREYFENQSKSKYDKYPSMQPGKLMEFEFLPTQFEVFEKGKSLAGKPLPTQNELKATIVYSEVTKKEVVHISYGDSMTDIIRCDLEFDILIFNNDRIMLLTIPKNVGNQDCVGLAMSRTTIGPTRKFKEFESNEPYGCSLFTEDGIITKITFALNNPEALVELS